MAGLLMNIAPESIAFSFLFQAPAGGGSIISPMIMMGLIVAIFYFLLIRPQQQKQRLAQTQREQMLAALKAGDKVITNGGIYGTIVVVKEATSTVQLRIAQGVSVEVLRSAIANLQDSEAAAKEVEAAAK
jgi:preprotein translocase subunit YajC